MDLSLPALIVKVRNSSCCKVMFSQACISHSAHKGWDGGWCRPRQGVLPQSVNKRVVRIILECILLNCCRYTTLHSSEIQNLKRKFECKRQLALHCSGSVCKIISTQNLMETTDGTMVN